MKYPSSQIFYIRLTPQSWQQLYSHFEAVDDAAVLNCVKTACAVNLANPSTVNPEVGSSKSKYEKCCSQLSPYCKRHMAFSKADESLFCSCKT
jgi:hypothetical protein